MLRFTHNKIILLIISLSVSINSFSQLTVTPNQTAATLASTITGTGITVSTPSLTCAGQGNGTFTIAPGTTLGTGATVFGINSGILLSTGKAIGASGPETVLASTNNGTAGDPALAALALTPNLYDGCWLEFDFTAVGNSISFNYIFGSEEYNHSTCGPYDDAFAFFISGPGITGTRNMALVPGTTIPVTVNSVNSGVPGPGYTLANCTVMGPGSPFPAYFTDNTGGAYFTYKGFTTVLTASSTVTPCSTYHLKMSITDAGNDIYDSGVFIEAGSLTTPTITPGTVCVGGNSTFTAPLTGGTWSSSNTSVVVINPTSGVTTGISNGSATITYTIATGCFLTTSVTVNPLAPITGNNLICPGQTTTLNDPTAGGSWTSSNTNIAIVNITSGLVTAIAPGSVSISYTLPSGCATTTTLAVNPGATPVTGASVLCAGSSATLSDETPGGTWTTGNAAIATASTTGTIIGVSPGTATITYTLSNGCYVTATVVIPSTNAVILTPDTTICNGESVTIRVNGDPTLQYNWSPSTGLNNPNIMDPTATPSVITTYVMTASVPGTNCSVTKQMTVNVTSVSAIAGPDQIVCVKSPIVLKAIPDSGNYTYLWTGPNGYSNSLPDPVINYAQITNDGTYTIQITDNNSGCSGQATTMVTVVPGNILTNVTLEQTIMYGSTIQLNADNAVYYRWTPEDGSLSNPNINNPIAAPRSTTIYTVYGLDLNGCLDSASVLINVSFDSIFIPNAFTPNGDGLNDVFRVGNLGYYKIVEMNIFNRWGNMVYHAADGESRGWDGTYNGVPQDMGVYNYLIILSSPDGRQHDYKGNLTLIR